MRPTKEQEHFLHLCICVLDLCGRICRDILLKYVPTQNCLGISHGLRLSREQQRIVQNAGTNGNYNEFDITLVYTFLRNGCRNFPSPTGGWGKPPTGNSISDDVERIRILRNTAYGHVHAASMDTQTYNFHLNEITNICNRMDNIHSTYIVNTGVQYQQELQNILSISTQDDTLFKICKDKIAKIEADLMVMEQTKDEQFVEIKRVMEALTKEVIYIRTDVQNLRCHVNELRDAIAVPFQKRNQALYLKDRTTKVLHQHQHSLYTKRKSLEQCCLQKLENPPYLCVLVGGKGSGKSCTALEVINNFSNNRVDKYVVYSPDDLNAIQHMSPGDIMISIDDVEGNSSDLDDKSRTIDRYAKELDIIYRCHGVRLLITASCNVIAKVKSILNSSVNMFPDDAVVYLNEWCMTVEEKRKTFYKHRDLYCRTHAIESHGLSNQSECPITESEVEELIQSEPPCGFPRACKMFFTDKTCLRLGISFFRNTHEMLFQEIKEKYESSDKNERCQFLILCTVFISKSVSVDEIRKVATYLQMKKPNTMEVEHATTFLIDQHYIREDETQYTHEMNSFELLLSVLLVIGRYFPDVLLDFADRQMLFDFVCSSGYDEQSGDICCRMPRNLDERLAKKLLNFDLDSLHHRTITDEKFCRIVVQEMFPKYGWCSTELDKKEEETLSAVINTACELSHLDSFLKVMIQHLIQREKQFSKILKEGLFSCVYGGNVHKVAQYDAVSEDLRKNALIEAVKYQKEEVVLHYRSSLKNILVKTFRISVEHSSPKIVEIIFKGFQNSADEVLDCLSIAIDGKKSDIVKFFVEYIKTERMKGKEDRITEVIKRSIINHDLFTLQQLINKFYDLEISQEKIFIQIIECGFSKGLSFFVEIFSLSNIFGETISGCYVKAERNEDSSFFETYCNILRDCEITDNVLYDALQLAIEFQSKGLSDILLQRFPTHYNRFQGLLMKASAKEDTEILKAVFDKFSDKMGENMYECLKHAISHNKFPNARFILTNTDVPQVVVQNIFVECCQNDDPALVQGTIDLFGKENIVDSSLQTGILLSLGSQEVHVFDFLLREFENKWLKDGALQNIITEACRCKPKSMEKLQSILTITGKDSILMETWEICIGESSKSGNTETFIHCLEILGSNVQESTLMESFKSSFELQNHKAVNFLLRHSYFAKLGEKNRGQVLLLVFQSKNNDLMSYVISALDKDSFSNDVIENIFTLLTDQGNGDILEKFIKLVGTLSIPKELVLYSFECAISSNNSEIPALLAKHFKPEFNNEALDRMLMCSLEQLNIDNIQLMTGIPDLGYISQNTHKRFVEIASREIDVLRVFCECFDVTEIRDETFVHFIELALRKRNRLVFYNLIEKCAVQLLHTKKNELFLQVIHEGDKEMVECFLMKVGMEFEDSDIQLAVLMCSEHNYGQLMDYLLDDEVFGTSHISHDALANIYRQASESESTSSLDVIQRRFEIPTRVRQEFSAAQSSTVVNRDTISEDRVDTVFLGIQRTLVDTGNPNCAELVGTVHGVVNVLRR